MQEDPKVSLSDLTREIKGLSMGFKSSLQHPSKPWDRDVEFQRQNLRRHILQVIFKYPSSPQSDKLETALWIDTSHSVITRYRALISNMETKVQNTPQPDPRSGHSRFKRGEEGPVALRKLLNRFRSFLSAEEAFWTELVLRLAQTFDLTQARAVIAALSLAATDPAELAIRIPAESRSIVPPPPPTPGDPLPSAVKQKKLQFLQKCLISLGDLARYREQYNETGGRPKIDGISRAAKQRKGDAKAPAVSNASQTRPKVYAKASECYRQAKLLLPDEGNPSNQLAIVALYGGDTFEAITHYYRALCVSRPFPTARENLNKVLQRGYDNQRRSISVISNTDTDVDILKRNIILLHALWQFKPTSPKADELSKSVASTFKDLMLNRSLLPDLITKILAMSFGALWIRTNSSLDEAPESDAELFMLVHILYLLEALNDIGATQISEVISIIQGGAREDNPNLAQYITATFRRTLPALHIASTWLLRNVSYMHQKRDLLRALPRSSNAFISVLDRFWTSYAKFLTLLQKAFPRQFLPTLEINLEEDVEYAGFAPLVTSLESKDVPVQHDASVVHPNEEHLIRIRTILRDAVVLSKSDTTPLFLEGGSFTISLTTAPESAGVAGLAASSTPLSDFFGAVVDPKRLDDDAEDDSRTVSTEDPVGLAMNATLGENDDDEEEMEDERILYPQKASIPPPVPRSTYLTTNIAFPPPLSTAGSSSRNGNAGTTAEDLLSRVLGNISSVSHSRQRTTSDPLRALSSHPTHALSSSISVGQPQSAIMPGNTHAFATGTALGGESVEGRNRLTGASVSPRNWAESTFTPSPSRQPQFPSPQVTASASASPLLRGRYSPAPYDTGSFGSVGEPRWQLEPPHAVYRNSPLAASAISSTLPVAPVLSGAPYGGLDPSRIAMPPATVHRSWS